MFRFGMSRYMIFVWKAREGGLFVRDDPRIAPTSVRQSVDLLYCMIPIVQFR